MLIHIKVYVHVYISRSIFYCLYRNCVISDVAFVNLSRHSILNNVLQNINSAEKQGGNIVKKILKN